jgi:hypothetical protein
MESTFFKRVFFLGFLISYIIRLGAHSAYFSWFILALNRARSVQSTPFHPTSLRSVLVLSFHLLPSWTFLGFQPKICGHFYLPHPCCISHSWFYSWIVLFLKILKKSSTFSANQNLFVLIYDPEFAVHIHSCDAHCAWHSSVPVINLTHPCHDFAVDIFLRSCLL